MHLYTGSTFVYRPLCGPVDEQVAELYRKASVDVWDAWVFSVEDHGSVGGQLNIVGSVEKWQQHLWGGGRYETRSMKLKTK